MDDKTVVQSINDLMEALKESGVIKDKATLEAEKNKQQKENQKAQQEKESKELEETMLKNMKGW